MPVVYKSILDFEHYIRLEEASSVHWIFDAEGGFLWSVFLVDKPGLRVTSTPRGRSSGPGRIDNKKSCKSL